MRSARWLLYAHLLWGGAAVLSLPLLGQVTPSGGEIAVGATTVFQGAPATTSDALGDFVVVWQKQSVASGNWDVFARQYNKTGAPVGAEFQVNTTTGSGCCQLPTVASDAVGNFVVAWQSDEESGGLTGIFGRLYSISGLPVTEQFQVNTSVTVVGMRGLRESVPPTRLRSRVWSRERQRAIMIRRA